MYEPRRIEVAHADAITSGLTILRGSPRIRANQVFTASEITRRTLVSGQIGISAMKNPDRCPIMVSAWNLLMNMGHDASDTRPDRFGQLERFRDILLLTWERLRDRLREAFPGAGGAAGDLASNLAIPIATPRREELAREVALAGDLARLESAIIRVRSQTTEGGQSSARSHAYKIRDTLALKGQLVATELERALGAWEEHDHRAVTMAPPPAGADAAPVAGPGASIREMPGYAIPMAMIAPGPSAMEADHLLARPQPRP